MILLGSHFSEDANGSDDGRASALDSIDGVYNESKNAYAVLAQLSGYQSMQQILEIFATKIIGNLMGSVDKI